MSLPLDGSGPYDADVVVIGAGPAGLAAATRVRWVKGYHALSGSVCLVESGTPGGLLRWGSCVLTGPGWAMAGEKLAEQLLDEVARLRIPVVAARALSLERHGGLLHTRLHDGRVLRSLAVVVATGLRPLGNEAQYYLRGVRITFKGYEHFPALIRQCAEDAAGRGLVVVGNGETRQLAALLAAHASGAGPVTLLIHGEAVRVLGDARVEAVEAQSRDGTTHRIACGAVLMDYNGFELRPDYALDGLPLARDPRGFLAFDGFGRTSEPGVFAAGDIGGGYAATLPAFGHGVSAGLSAYAWAFEQKLGVSPTLFAYAPTEGPLPEEPVDLPELPADALVVELGRDGQRPVPWAAGSPVGALQRTHPEALAEAVAARTVTVHRAPGGPPARWLSR